MFYQPQPLKPATDWRDTIARGDILLFRFPVSDPENEGAGPKARPCLVLETPKMLGKRFIQLAYGTSARTKANRGYEVIVREAGGMEAAGLAKPTRFVGARRILVSIDHPGFEMPEASNTPKIGRLDSVLLDRMDGIRARLQAESDIRSEARRARREEQGRWDREGRGFLERNHTLRASNTSK